MLASFKSLWRNALQSLNLTRCACCGKHTPNIETDRRISRWVCADCSHLINMDQRVGCIQCGLALGPRPQAFGWKRCRHCRAEPDETIETLVVQDYLPPFKNWILSLKYADDPSKARMLADFLLQSMESGLKTYPDVLIPTPISQKSLKARGYNQAELIAKHLGRELNIPVESDWLRKIKDTPQQSSSGKQQREENLRNAIICTKPLSPSIKIGLVDDVITTGSTLNTCAQAMRKAGAHHFQFFAICRTPE